jgi:hypothetical protein
VSTGANPSSGGLAGQRANDAEQVALRSP